MRRGWASLALLLALALPALAKKSPTPVPDPAPAPLPPPTPEPVAPEVSAAREAFEAGEAAYEAGDYETAIGKFRQAYDLKPHPSVLFNIGQAYERTVDYTNAVDYFQRYLKEIDAAAPDRTLVENRVRALKKLPARVRVAAVPDDATVTLRGAETLQARAGELVKLPAGHYVLEVSHEGYEPAKDELDAEIGQPYSFSFRLTAQSARVSITTSPGSARIFVDDKLVGQGRYMDRIPVGMHMVRAEYEGRPPSETPVLLKAETTVRVRLVLPAPPTGGRREFIAGLTGLGALLGVSAAGRVTGQLPQATPGTTVAALAAGALIGFGSSYLATGRGITEGTSGTILGSSVWGFAGGTSLSLAVGASNKNANAVGTVSAIGSTAVAALVAPQIHVEGGEAALYNSGALWGTVSGLLAAPALDRTDEAPSLGFAGLLAGLGTGIITAKLTSGVSRSRVALIDVSGLAGIATGAAAATALRTASQPGASSRAAARWSLGGMVIGLGLGAYLTRHYDRHDDNTPVTTVARYLPIVAPTEHGLMALWVGGLD